MGITKGLALRAVKRLTPQEVHEVARRVVTNQGLLTNQSRALRSAFMLLLSLTDWSAFDVATIGAFYGDLGDVIPGRTLNGFPMFHTLRLIHTDDVSLLTAEIKRLTEALGDAT